MIDNGIVWCIFDGSYSDAIGSAKIYEALRDELVGVNTTDFTALKTALEAINNAALSDWDNSVISVGSTSSKTLTIVFWAEHEPAKDIGGWYDADVVNSVDLTFAVSQID